MKFEKALRLKITVLKSTSFYFYILSEHTPKKLLGEAKRENVNKLDNQPTFNENRTNAGGEADDRRLCSRTSLASEEDPLQGCKKCLPC